MKDVLRKETLLRRSALTAPERSEKSIRIVKQVRNLEAYQQARTIMMYMDFRGEVETTAFIEESLAAGKRIILPLCNKDKTITPLEIRNLTDDIKIGTWGIREPKPEVCPSVDPVEIDLVLVPGVAFDLKGNRLGYGAGYYDRFVLRLRKGTPLVALAFEVQILPEIKAEPHDHPMDMVITEDRMIRCN